MIFGHKTPEARVGREVAVVAHHPIIVHFERIFVGFFAVDEDFVALHLEFVAFVNGNATLIQGEFAQIEWHSGTFARYPNGAIVGSGPLLRHIEREEPVVPTGFFAFDSSHFGVLLEIVVELIGERHTHDLSFACARKVFARHPIFFEEIDARSLFESHVVDQLHMLGTRLFFAIDVNVIVLNLECLTGNGNATLDIVFATIDRARNDFSSLSTFFQYLLTDAVDFGKGCTLILRRK